MPVTRRHATVLALGVSSDRGKAVPLMEHRPGYPTQLWSGVSTANVTRYAALVNSGRAPDGSVFLGECQHHTGAAQLTAEGWQALADLFTSPGHRRAITQITVVQVTRGSAHLPARGRTSRRRPHRYDIRRHSGCDDGSADVGSSCVRTGRFAPRECGPSAVATRLEDIRRGSKPCLTRTAALRYIGERLATTHDRTVVRNLRAARAAFRRAR